MRDTLLRDTLLLSLLCAACGGSLSNGHRAFQAGKFKEAETEYRAALEEVDGIKAIEIEYQLGLALFQQGEARAAATSLRHALELARGQEVPRELLGPLTYNLAVSLEAVAEEAGGGVDEMALSLYRESAQLGVIAAAFNLAVALSNDAENEDAQDEALGWFGGLAQHDPSDDKAWCGMGTLFKRTGRKSAAAWAFFVASSRWSVFTRTRPPTP